MIQFVKLVSWKLQRNEKKMETYNSNNNVVCDTVHNLAWIIRAGQLNAN